MVEKKQKTISAVVVSNKMENTVVVVVESYKKHPKYEKFVKKTKRYSVHNENENVNIGDKVEIKEVKPISKTKKFILVK